MNTYYRSLLTPASISSIQIYLPAKLLIIKANKETQETRMLGHLRLDRVWHDRIRCKTVNKYKCTKANV